MKISYSKVGMRLAMSVIQCVKVMKVLNMEQIIIDHPDKLNLKTDHPKIELNPRCFQMYVILCQAFF